MNGPIKAAVVGVIREAGGVAMVIRAFNLSDDFDLRCNKFGGGCGGYGG